MIDELDKWTISQDGKTVRIRDGDGLLVAKFEYRPLNEGELEAMLAFYKYYFERIGQKLDEVIMNGGM